MPMLPLLIDTQDALHFLASTPDMNDAQRAYLIAFLSREGWTNRQIRGQLGIDKVYTLTHFKRVGLALSDLEFQLWDKNPERITLGHLRCLCHLSSQKREPLLRSLLVQRVSVAKLQLRLREHQGTNDADIRLYERQMEDVLGRGIKITFDPLRQSGKLTLDFFGLDDLDQLTAKLGFTPGHD